MDDDREETHMLPTPTPTPASPPPAPSRRMLWFVGMTAALCALTLILLIPVSTSSATWKSTSALRQSIDFLQQNTSASPTLARPPIPQLKSDNSSEKGIVLCLHNGIASMGVSLIRELRCLGNTEVIQVYHCFPHELSAATRELLTRNDNNVEIIDVCTELLRNKTVFNGNQKLAETFRGYWIKPLALYHTRLDEVILLDADAILLHDPAKLRTYSTGYNRTGTVFFKDRIVFMRKFFNTQMTNGQQMLHYILDTFDYGRFGLAKPASPSTSMLETFAYKEETGHEMDSSLVYIDKRRAGKALDILLFLSLELRFDMTFSWGDKEAFWFAYELAQQDYFFSPWGLSLLDSVPNEDLTQHPTTMCGQMAHFVPTEDVTEAPELLYVNGKVLLEPFAVGINNLASVGHSRLFNINPTHVTPRYKYSEFDLESRETFECMDKLGSTPLPDTFKVHLLRRRHHFFAAETGVLEALDRCDV